MFISCKQTGEKERLIAQWVDYTGNPKFQKNKKVVLISGDEEYRSEEALPRLGKILAQHHGFDCTVLFAQDPQVPGVIHPAYTKNIPGLEVLKSADLMILFTRFRDLPNEQMEHIEDFLKGGKPIIAIRTATHAFRIQDSLSSYMHWGNYYKGPRLDWDGGFGRKILGVNWHSHHGQHAHESQRGVFPDKEKVHPILNGITDGSIWGPTDVYGVPLPMDNDIEIILSGQVIKREGQYDEDDLFFGMRSSDTKLAKVDQKTGIDKNKPMMPIVWSKPYLIEQGEKGKAIISTIGASTDLLNAELRRMFVNTTYHLLDFPVLEKAKVDLIGKYEPSQFKFHKEGYWETKNMLISSHQMNFK